MGFVFNIQRLSVHDGPGIRTTVFLKGCNLKCLWCHNPESQSSKPQLAFYKEKCVYCNKCADICSNHVITSNQHLIDRNSCTVCSKCVDLCTRNALEIIGQDRSSDEVIDEIIKDRIFFKNSGGGITISGGEPLNQPDFTLEILKKSKQLGIHTCVDTSGFGKPEDFQKILPYTDIFLYDWKVTDNIKHKKFCGVSNVLIKNNLIMLDKMGAKIVLRCPIIPNINNNEEHYKGIIKLTQMLDGIVEINIMPYHLFGRTKCENIGMINPLGNTEALLETEKNKCIDFISAGTDIVVK